MTAEKAKIVERIKKLMALADVQRGATPEEAALAAAKAQALLFEHNLTIQHLQDEADAKEGFGVNKVELSARKQHRGWHRTLFYGIAKRNFCDAAYYTNSGRMDIIGKSHNVEVVTYLYTYLSKEIDRLGRDERNRQGVERSRRAKWLVAFGMGATGIILRRLDEQFKKQADASADSRAMVIVAGQELAKAKEKFFPNIKAGRASKFSDASGYLSGVKAGRNIPLTRGISGGSNPHGARLIG